MGNFIACHRFHTNGLNSMQRFNLMRLNLIRVSICCIIITVPILAFARIPNDPLFSEQWYLKKIGAPKAWDIATGNKKVVVAVIDTGVDLTHPDLKKNLWKNKKEIPNDAIDNDKNGFVDDYDGWDFTDHDKSPEPQGNDGIARNHGTMVAGLIGAVSNNKIGISGVTQNIQIMPLRAMAVDGGGETAIVAQAVEYAIQMKADIINLSVVGFEDDPLLRTALQKAWKKNIVIISAAGNEMTDLNKQKAYPVCTSGIKKKDIIIGVTAVDQKNTKLPASNYGASCVTMAAPGADIISTSVTTADGSPSYIRHWSGSSMAAPLVTGAAALIKSINPKLSNALIRDILLQSADPIKKKWQSTKGIGTRIIKCTKGGTDGQKI